MLCMNILKTIIFGFYVLQHEYFTMNYVIISSIYTGLNDSSVFQ